MYIYIIIINYIYSIYMLRFLCYDLDHHALCRMTWILLVLTCSSSRSSSFFLAGLPSNAVVWSVSLDQAFLRSSPKGSSWHEISSSWTQLGQFKKNETNELSSSKIRTILASNNQTRKISTHETLVLSQHSATKVRLKFIKCLALGLKVAIPDNQ